MGIIALILIGIAGYRYREFARLKLLGFLHSFDDHPEVADEERQHAPPGQWYLIRTDMPESDSLTESEREQIEQIQSLGYLSGYEEVPLEMGVTVHDTSEACPGYNIVLSGHAPEVILMDMNGEIVHSWFNSEVTLDNLWPDTRDKDVIYDTWRKVILADNGDLTLLVRGGGLVKLDRDSNILWITEGIAAHHDLDTDEDGNLYTLGRDIHINEYYSSTDSIVEDYICIFDSLGNETRRISTYDVLDNSIYAPVLNRTGPGGDRLHCNAVEYIGNETLPDDYTGPLRPGTVLLSHRSVSLVCGVDLEEESVYWAESGFWTGQHDPNILPDGTILVFDNQGRHEQSTVLQFDPETRTAVWSYTGTVEHPFYSRVLGSCHRLPNGNTIIIESTMGRAFEVTPDGETVWEYFNPHRAGENNQFVAVLFDVVRVPAEKVDSWLGQ